MRCIGRRPERFNAGLEAGLGKRTSLELTGDYNPWTLDRDENRKLKFWSVMPEFRYCSANASTAIFSDCTPATANTISAVCASLS